MQKKAFHPNKISIFLLVANQSTLIHELGLLTFTPKEAPGTKAATGATANKKKVEVLNIILNKYRVGDICSISN